MELTDFEMNDTVWVRDEKFTVSVIGQKDIILTPANENGHGQLQLNTLSGDRAIFTRSVGVSYDDIRVEE